MILGDHMFLFFFHILVSMFIIFTTFHIFNKKEIGILEVLVLLFLFQTCINSINNKSILENIVISLFIILNYYLYIFLYQKSITKKIYTKDKILINRGLINFHELINEHISYESLIINLKKKGINDPSEVDYCIKQNNDLIIFKKNSIKNYPISIIIDGKVLKDNLFSIHKTYEWLEHKINENNLELSNINYAYFKNKEVYFVTN